MTLISANNWPTISQIYKDPLSGDRKGKIKLPPPANSPRQDIGTTSHHIFRKTNLIVARAIQSTGINSVNAYETWQIVGTTASATNPDSIFVRRGGDFSKELYGGDEYVSYRKFGYYKLFEARQNNLTYASASRDDVIARLSKMGLTSTQVNSFMLSDTNKSFFLTGIISDSALTTRLVQFFKINLSGGQVVSKDAFESAAAERRSGVPDTIYIPGLGVFPLPKSPVPPGGPPSTGGGGGGGGGGKKDTPKPPPLPRPEIKIVTRMPKGYLGRPSSHGARPQMVQRYRSNLDKEGKPRDDDTVFTFDYVPQGIKYSGLAGEWVEIPRAEDVPFVDWARWQLMKVSFSFIIANNVTVSGGRTVPDGLETSVDQQILQLRKMAQRKIPVMLFNFDDMLSIQLRRGVGGEANTKPNMEFVITDLSVTATRRTSGEDGGPTSPSDIAVAQVEITLTEVPVEVIGIVALPPIVSVVIGPPGKKTGGPTDLKYLPDTDYLAPKDSASNTIGET